MTLSAAPDFQHHRPGLPRHLAIVMDGNNRWARQRNLPGHEGHQAGEHAVHEVIRFCGETGIEVVTLFAFSSENWRRSEEEVSHLMRLFVEALSTRVPELHDNDVRLRFIGDRTAFSEQLQRLMGEAENLTLDNARMTVVVAVNYGGQWDITRAVQRVLSQLQQKQLSPDDVDAQLVQSCLSTGSLPLPDMLVRTGGEQRISNFMLWQLAYAELFFTPTLWPDFGSGELTVLLEEYRRRQRRFGRSGDDPVLGSSVDRSPEC